MIFLIAFLIIMILMGFSLVYDVRQFHKLSIFQKIENKKLSWIASCSPIAVAIIVTGIILGFQSAIIILLHFTVFLIICNLIILLIRKISKKQISNYISGITAIIITICYMSAGWYFAHHVYETSYNFETAKNINNNSLRIVQIADSHIGETLNGEDFAKEVEKIQNTNPDLVVITGDFADDDSKMEDIVKSCQALGSLKTTYGVFFAFGNHDKGYMKNQLNYTEKELRNELTKNNVTILEDQAVLIDDSFYVIGRQDKSEKKRKDIDVLTENLDKSKYMIVLDHQPNDYDNEAKAEVDLVLSGHTHGGHIFPAGPFGIITGANDMIYGTKHIENTDFVVTSGISGWGIPFKTGAISEYVVIDIH